MSDLEEDLIGTGSEAGDDDLFGDGDSERDAIKQDDASEKSDVGSNENHVISHHEEDEDEARSRQYASEEPQAEMKERVVMDMSLYKHGLPKPEDGNLRSFRVPQFLKIIPHRYDSDHFTPSEWDMENARRKQPKLAVRYRINPETGEMESNTLLHRWSDGSITISVGEEHFEIQRKSLATLQSEPYDQLKDAHYYACAAHLATNTFVTVGHIVEQFQVKPNANIEDDGIAIFKNLMAKQTLARQGPTVDAEAIKLTQLDPEQMKRDAELAERERAKAQRRRENAQARQGGYGSRYGGGSGMLSIEGIERRRPGDGGTSGKKRGAPGSRRRPRGNEYDSDDEPGATRKGDNYDYNDDFLVRSDEEIEAEDDDEEEEEEELLEEEEEERPRKKRQKTADSDEDAEGEMDEESRIEHARRGRRQVIDDDEEEEY